MENYFQYMEVVFLPSIAFFMGKMLAYMHLLTGESVNPIDTPDR